MMNSSSHFYFFCPWRGALASAGLAGTNANLMDSKSKEKFSFIAHVHLLWIPVLTYIQKHDTDIE